jgi:N-acetylneuraminic acid mutarotase
MKARIVLALFPLAAFALVHCGAVSDGGPGAAPAPAADAGPANDASAVDASDAGPATDAATPPLARMTKSRSLFATVKGKDGRLRTFGGLTTDGVDDTTDAYDPVANKWTATASMASIGRYGLAATADASGNVYVVGGTPDGMTPTATVELYSPADDTWKSLADLPTARLGLGAATGKDGRIFAIGGRDTAGAPTDLVEVYSPATQTWSTAPSLPTKRLALAAVTGADGKIYAIGGRDA